MYFWGLSEGHMSKRKQGKGDPEGGSTHELATALYTVYQHVERLLHHEKLSMPPRVSVPLDLYDNGRKVWEDRADQLLASVRQVALHAQANSSGQGLWCFQCRRYGCAHGEPSSPAHIFSGYSPTGKPTWEAFIDACIRLKPAGMDALFDEKPIPLALVLMASDLNEERLPEFTGQSEALEFCGQVVAGLLPKTLWTSRGTHERVALSVQVFRRSVRAGYEYEMNLMGFSERELLDASMAGGRRSKAELLAQVIQRTRRRLRGVKGEIATLSGAMAVRHAAFVDRVLSQLRGDISQICRYGTLRTKHAQKRHKGGERPTGNALSDARRASHEHILFDNHHKTYVILGRNQRAHVFSPQGRHVTSLRLQKGEVDRKVQRHRWRSISRQEFDSFGQAINRSKVAHPRSPKGPRTARR